MRGRPDPGLRSLGRAGGRRGAQGRSHGLGLEIGQLPGLMPLLLHADDQTAQPPPITHYSGSLPLLRLAQARGGREFWAGYGDVGWLGWDGLGELGGRDEWVEWAAVRFPIPITLPVISCISC